MACGLAFAMALMKEAKLRKRAAEEQLARQRAMSGVGMKCPAAALPVPAPVALTMASGNQLNLPTSTKTRSSKTVGQPLCAEWMFESKFYLDNRCATALCIESVFSAALVLGDGCSAEKTGASANCVLPFGPFNKLLASLYC